MVTWRIKINDQLCQPFVVNGATNYNITLDSLAGCVVNYIVVYYFSIIFKKMRWTVDPVHKARSTARLFFHVTEVCTPHIWEYIFGWTWCST